MTASSAKPRRVLRVELERMQRRGAALLHRLDDGHLLIDACADVSARQRRPGVDEVRVFLQRGFETLDGQRAARDIPTRAMEFAVQIELVRALIAGSSRFR